MTSELVADENADGIRSWGRAPARTIFRCNKTTSVRHPWRDDRLDKTVLVRW
ncbi:hypothetical protein [Intrasporangium sp. DVR]|uniref:hypothetical protein n=1 Tax=Intrasporangium sp. DVR TaxID=3127867 RepID=UPI00333FC808